jgi:hypothetical protein
MNIHVKKRKENVVFIYNGILCSCEEEQNIIIRRSMDGIGEHHSK